MYNLRELHAVVIHYYKHCLSFFGANQDTEWRYKVKDALHAESLDLLTWQKSLTQIAYDVE